MQRIEKTASGAYRYGTMPEDGGIIAPIRSKLSQKARDRFFRQFMEWTSPNEDSLILDVGATSDLTAEESNFFEKQYPYPDRIVACGIEPTTHWNSVFPKIPYIRGDGLRLPFGNQMFDIVFCSAVIEHVGSRRNQAKLIRECLRVGRTLFLTTPDRTCPVELHTFIPILHWLPLPVFRWFLSKLPSHSYLADERVLNPLTAGDLKRMVPTGSMMRLKKYTIFGIPTNLLILANAKR